MKKYILTLLATLICLFLFADISSTTTGGDRCWNTQATWIGGIIPGASDNVIINAVVQVNSNVSCNNLTVGVSGVVENISWASYTLTVQGKLANAGIVRNNLSVGLLTCNIAGHIVNSGSMSLKSMYLTGNANQTLTNTGTMNPANLIDNNPTSSITLLADLVLPTVLVNLGGAILILNSGAGTYDLSMSSGSLKNAVIQGGSGATLSLSAGSYLENVNINEIVFAGTIMVSSNVTIGTLINTGTLTTYAFASNTLLINEGLENHGSIINNPTSGHFTVNLAGHLANYGTLSNYAMYLSNSGQISLWQDPDSPAISCANFMSEPTSANYQALSDLRFSGTGVDFKDHTLILNTDSETYNLYMSSGSLKNAVIQGGSGATLSLSAGSYLENVNINEIVFAGTIMVSSNVTIGTLINTGTLTTYAFASNTLLINEGLENHGSIINNPTSGHFTVNLAGNLANYGTMQNHAVYINGTENQDIMNVGTMTVSNFYLVSEIGAAAWYFNGILNTNFQNHTQIGVSVANLGVWQPRNTSGDGRLITIGNVALYLSVPENLSTYLSGSVLKLRWNQVPGAVHYNVYYSDLPQGPFSTLLSQVFDNDLSDGIVQTDLSGSEPHRFYQVRAGN
jgi:hypothetical protein